MMPPWIFFLFDYCAPDVSITYVLKFIEIVSRHYVEKLHEIVDKVELIEIIFMAPVHLSFVGGGKLSEKIVGGKEEHNVPAALDRELLHSAQPWGSDVEPGFLLHLTHDCVNNGLSRLYVASG